MTKSITLCMCHLKLLTFLKIIVKANLDFFFFVKFILKIIINSTALCDEKLMTHLKYPLKCFVKLPVLC